MKSKSELINLINVKHHAGLNSRNTSYSNINVSKEVWWLNIPVSKFQNDVHLLLNGRTKAIWITLPVGFVKNLSSKFKIREDRNAVDLEISADRNSMYLKDVKSGGTYFDFKDFIIDEIE